MEYLKERIFGILVTVVVSYVLATHYAFQWYTSILVCLLIIGLIILLNWLLNSLYIALDFASYVRPVIALLILVALIVIPKYEGVEEYRDCSYPPFKIVKESEMDYKEMFESLYIDDEMFTGFITYANTYVEAYNTETEDTFGFSFGGRSSEIQQIAYYEGYIYATGKYLHEDRSTDHSIYSLHRYNVETKEIEMLYDSENYISVISFNGLLYISANIYDGRKNYYYEGDFNLVLTEDYDYNYIMKVDSFGTLDVVQKNYGIYLYEDNVFVTELEVNDREYEGKKFIYFYNDQFYITSSMTGETFYTDIFDINGEYISTLEDYELEDNDNYLLFSEHYVIENDAQNMDELVVWESRVMDQKGNVICPVTAFRDLRIIYKNQTLYGLYGNSMYEIEEVNYTVPFKYANPQHGFIYWTSVVAVTYLALKRKSIF